MAGVAGGVTSPALARSAFGSVCPMGGSREMSLRRAGVCATCGRELDKGSLAWWDAEAKVVYCLQHRPADRSMDDQPSDGSARPDATAPAMPDTGEAGRSAQREHDRRAAKREQRVRENHPIIGGALLAIFDDPQSTRAWANGAVGERVVGRHLDTLADHGVHVLHDRRVPRSSANIDHIAIAPSGIYVIDAKHWEAGRVEKRGSGTIFKPGPAQLYVGGRNCTPLVAKMAAQVGVVMEALDGLPEAAGVPIRPMLTFVNAEWGLFASPIDIAGVLVMWPKAMAKHVAQPGSLPPEAVQRIAQHLAGKLKPA